MNARISGLIGVVTVLAGVAACHKDPTAAGAGAPTQVIASFASLTIARGKTGDFLASVVDQDLTQLQMGVSFSMCSGGSSIATVATDPSYHPVPNTSTQAIVTGVAVGSTCVIASSSGVKPDSVQITVN